METLLNKQKVLTNKQEKHKQPTHKLDKEYKQEIDRNSTVDNKHYEMMLNLIVTTKMQDEILILLLSIIWAKFYRLIAGLLAKT